MTRDIPIDLIDPDPEQPRRHFDESKIEELSQSMDAKGLVVPILVRPAGDSFVIVHGERRWRAAKRLGWETIRAEVRHVDADEARWLSLIENVQRQDLSPIEEARAFEERLAGDLTQAELGERIGKSQSYISHKLRILRLPEPLRFFVDREAITEGHARQLMKLKGIYPAGAVDALDWGRLDGETIERARSGELFGDGSAVFGLLRDIRPEDNPPVWPGLAPVPPVLCEGCTEFFRYNLSEGNPPLWVVGAFWWACVTIDCGASVADLSEAIDSWEERFLSGVGYVWMGPTDAPSAPSTDSEWLATQRFWGHRSDLRHAGVLDSIEADGKLPAPGELRDRALRWVYHNGCYVEPSSLQEWGFTYQGNEERYRRAKADEKAGELKRWEGEKYVP